MTPQRAGNRGGRWNTNTLHPNGVLARKATSVFKGGVGDMERVKKSLSSTWGCEAPSKSTAQLLVGGQN